MCLAAQGQREQIQVGWGISNIKKIDVIGNYPENTQTIQLDIFNQF